MGDGCSQISKLRAFCLLQLRHIKEESALGYILAIVPRILFLGHAICCIKILNHFYMNVYSTELKRGPLYIGVILLAIETLYTICARRGHEYSYIWCSGFSYIITLVPTIWLLELALLQNRQDQAAAPNNVTVTTTITTTAATTISLAKSYMRCLNGETDCSLDFLKNFTELGLITVIIVGRWMLPRGDLTRDQLSALLIGYLNIAADLTEFAGLHSKAGEIMYSRTATVTVLSVYSLSLLQFVIVTTSTTYEYNEQEKIAIERLKTKTSQNIPAYLQPHARKLRRSSISKNIDKLTVQSFATGQRSGRRRRALTKDPPMAKHLNRNRRVKPVKTRRLTVLEEDSRRDSQDMILCPVETTMPTVRIEKCNGTKEIVKDQAEDQKPEDQQCIEFTSSQGSSNQSDKYKKWKRNMKVSQRIQRIRKSIKDENWKELSHAISDLKSEPNKNISIISDETFESMLKPSEEEVSISLKTRLVELLQSEIGSILIAMLFQECPFLITRVAFIYIYKTHSRGLIFYTTKNLFMLTFLSYRLWVASQE